MSFKLGLLINTKCLQKPQKHQIKATKMPAKAPEKVHFKFFVPRRTTSSWSQRVDCWLVNSAVQIITGLCGGALWFTDARPVV